MLYAIELEQGKKTLQRSRHISASPSRMSEIRQDSIDDTARTFRLFVEGDDAAFTELYQVHNQKIFVYCSKIVRDSDAAKDITHSLWEKVIALRQEPKEIKNPIGFFLRMARNLCL